jgi:hypothetical protein
MMNSEILAKLRSKVRLRTRIRKLLEPAEQDPNVVDAIADPNFAGANLKRLKAYRNKHKGERCFIIGNGPSLNKMNLRALDNEFTFGVNGIFYKYDEVGFKSTYYVVEDDMVVKENLERIKAIDYSVRFFPARYLDLIGTEDDRTMFMIADFGFYRDFHPYYCKPRFSKRCDKVIYAGQTVTYMNLQLAYYMGFHTVYLIGMDFSYSIPESAKVTGVRVLSQEDDPNHFHPDYFGKGKTWKFPKLDNCLLSYEHAKKVYEESGRRIYNATVGGKLEAFDRVNFTDLVDTEEK